MLGMLLIVVVVIIIVVSGGGGGGGGGVSIYHNLFIVLVNIPFSHLRASQ